jgi:hypothetical protein
MELGTSEIKSNEFAENRNDFIMDTDGYQSSMSQIMGVTI